MTLPKSIRGLVCLHPRGTAPQPHLAPGARGAAGGSAGGRREPGVARAGRREGRAQAEPPSLPGPSLEKEGRKEGGRREGREGGGEPKGFAPQQRDPGDGGARGGPAGSPLPSAPPGRPGLGSPGAPAPALGRNGVPVDFFPPLPSLLSLLLPLSSPLPSPQLHGALQVRPRSAPLASPKNALKGNREPDSGSRPWARGAGRWADTPPPPKKNLPPHTSAASPSRAPAAGAEGRRGAAGSGPYRPA